MAVEFGRVLREGYVGFLGFRVDWEHRHQDNAPVSMRISRGDRQSYLSEHYGGATPGSFCEVSIDNVGELRAELIAKDYKYNRSGAR